MTVTITQNVRDITGASDSAMWWFSSPLRAIDGEGVITQREIPVRAVDGVLTVELEPGPATVRFANVTYAFTVPDVDAELWPLIQAAVDIPPATPDEVLADAVAEALPGAVGAALPDAVAAYFAANPISGGSSLPDVPATGDCWGLPGVMLSATAADLSIGAGGIYYVPFSVNAPIIVTGARFNVSELSATATNVRVGIYGATGIAPDAHSGALPSGPTPSAP